MFALGVHVRTPFESWKRTLSTRRQSNPNIQPMLIWEWATVYDAGPTNRHFDGMYN